MITTDDAGQRWADTCDLCRSTRKDFAGNECSWCRAVRMKYGKYLYPIDKSNAHLFSPVPAAALDWTTKPMHCPFCAGARVVCVNTWTAQSGDLCDKDNVAELDEYQCEGACKGRSFWV